LIPAFAAANGSGLRFAIALVPKAARPPCLLSQRIRGVQCTQALAAVGHFTCLVTRAPPALLLAGIVGRCCFDLVQESLLMFLVIAPKKDGENDRRKEHRPSKWSSDSTNAFSKYVSANSERCRPHNSAGRVEDEEPQRG